MPHTTIREIHGDKRLDVMYWLDTYAFRSSPPLSDEAGWREMFGQRQGIITCLALFEDQAPVATAVGTAMTQQVRGALFGMGGIWGVATRPAARRKGYSRRLLSRLLAAVREEGRVLSCLYPFRESFYQRLGYVTFPQTRTAKLTPSALLPLLKKDLGGQVELVLIGDGYDVYRDYLRKLRERTHGMALFDAEQKASAQRNNFWLALAKVEGEVVGLMLYDLKGKSVAEFNFRAVHFYYDTSQGRYLLLEWIARHVDQASQVEVWLPPFELPETWLADLQVSTAPAFRAPMGRVLDVARIGGMHTGPGRFAARITDPLCPWNGGLWQFETLEGTLQVSAADRADCDLSIQALAALIYGTHDPGDFVIRGWGNPAPGVQDTMRGMFPPRLPYLHEHF
jgi:GNAT superfamily N-acetyltransferase